MILPIYKHKRLPGHYPTYSGRTDGVSQNTQWVKPRSWNELLGKTNVQFIHPLLLYKFRATDELQIIKRPNNTITVGLCHLLWLIFVK